jgi:tetratricopeptide (TPR) repeat protein
MLLHHRTSTPSTAAIERQLERILASRGFARAERMKRFLRFVVEQSLLEDSTPINEYAVAVTVYDRPALFDPRLDPIVRVDAGRLRAKLREYYMDEGRQDDVVISMVKGSYSASVEERRRENPRVFEPSQRSDTETESHHLYLMGRHHWNKRNPAGIIRAIECFNAAVKLNPDDALAHAGLADCRAAQAWFEMGAPATLWKQACEQAATALEIDPTLSQGMTTQAFRAAAYEWKWEDSETAFRQAILANPDYATAHHWYGIYCLAPQRRLNAAMEELLKACELDPLSPVIRTHLGHIQYFRRNFDEAIAHYRRAIEVDPSFSMAYWHLGFALIQTSHFDAAFASLQQAQTLGFGDWQVRWATGYLHARAGNRIEAEESLGCLQSPEKNDYVSPLGIALVCAGLNDTAQAFRYLQAALRERTAKLIHLKVDPDFDMLKTDFRFGVILKSMNLL